MIVCGVELIGNEAIIAMVSLNYGVGIVPELVLNKSPLKDKVKQISMSPALNPYKVGICIQKKGRFMPTVQAFCQMIE